MENIRVLFSISDVCIYVLRIKNMRDNISFLNLKKITISVSTRCKVTQAISESTIFYKIKASAIYKNPGSIVEKHCYLQLNNV